MLKISEGKIEKQSLTLKLEGRVVGPWASELLRVAEGLLTIETKVVLDLIDVSFVDEKGATVLAGLRRRGAKLLRPSPFVAEQLKAFIDPAV
jgi:anti-anti-sigma regulatory factor